MSLDTSTASPLEERSDAELIEHTRTGSQDAYAELWRRHSNAGRTVARSITSSLDPDDLVSESFARIYQAVRRGKGPTGAFRPYLFTTIRNTAAAWGRARHETSLDTLDSFEDPETNEASSIDALDRSLSTRAFRSLPTRWQEVLWYTEIEAMTPAEVAPLLGMKANSVSALAYRAREGLREAWIQAHLQTVDDDSEHAFTISRLGSYARGNLSARDTAKVEAHLDACQRCTIVAAEAKEVGSRMALVLLPLVAGAAGAAGYTAWLQTGGGSAAAAAAMPAGVTSGAVLTAHLASATAPGAGAVASGAAGSGGGAASTAAAGAGLGGAATAGLTGGVIAAIGVGALAVITAAAFALGPVVFPAGSDPGTSVSAGGTSEPTDAPRPGTTPSQGSTTPPGSPTTPVPAVPAAPEPTPRQTPDQASPAAPTAGPQVPSPSSPPVESVDSVDPVDPVDPTTPLELPEATMTADSGGGYLWPSFSGTAAAGSTVEILDGEEVVASTVVPTTTHRSPSTGVETEAWSTGPVDLGRTGTFSLTVRQTLGNQVSVSAVPTSMTIAGPSVSGLKTFLAVQYLDVDVPLVVIGAPNGVIAYTVDGADEQRVELDADGRGTLTGDAVAVGFHELELRGVDRADPSRTGPTTSVEYLSLAGLLSTDAAVAARQLSLDTGMVPVPVPDAVPTPTPDPAIVDPVGDEAPPRTDPVPEPPLPPAAEPVPETQTPTEAVPDPVTPEEPTDTVPAQTTDVPPVP